MTYIEDFIQYCTTKVIRSDMKSLMKDYMNINIIAAKVLFTVYVSREYLNMEPAMHFSMHINVYLLSYHTYLSFYN